MRIFSLLAALASVACAPITTRLPAVSAIAETEPVSSRDDAADDPAIWVNENDPSSSVVLGTDKRAGLYVYDLEGNELQFLKTGAVNNVDLRQGIRLGEWSGDIAAASNRSNDTVALYVIENGTVRETGSFPSALNEPYGLCLGKTNATLFAFVAYKTGDLIAYRIESPAAGAPVARMKLETQLEGCVFDDTTGALYVGEETRGIWKAMFDGAEITAPELIDAVGGESGVKADVEGLSIYPGDDGSRYLIASSQGNNSFAVYDIATEAFITRFEIEARGGVDGVEETDGIETVSASLGPNFPRGVLVVQDGRNHPRGFRQNFKIVDWREIEMILESLPTE